MAICVKSSFPSRPFRKFVSRSAFSSRAAFFVTIKLNAEKNSQKLEILASRSYLDRRRLFLFQRNTRQMDFSIWFLDRRDRYQKKPLKSPVLKRKVTCMPPAYLRTNKTPAQWKQNFLKAALILLAPLNPVTHSLDSATIKTVRKSAADVSCGKQSLWKNRFF